MSDRIRFRSFHGEYLRGIGRVNAQEPDAIPTPFPSWNKHCGEEGGRVGIAKGWILVMAGIPSTGKSSLVLNMATHAIRAGHIVGNINFEMSSNQVATRFLAAMSGVDRYLLERGRGFSQAAFDQAVAEVDRVKEETGGCLVSNDETAFSIDQIGDSYQALADAGAEMVIVDYAQLIDVKDAPGVYEQTKAIASILKKLTKRHMVATICLTQFNREAGKKRDVQPRREDISGGAHWEQMANQIVLLDHSTRITDPFAKTEQTKLICDKNRHGLQPFEVPIFWTWRDCRVVEYEGTTTVSTEDLNL